MKCISDLKPNQKITVYYKDGRVEKCVYLGVQGNPDIMKKYADKNNMTQAFGIVVYSEEQSLYKNGQKIPVLLFPETIEKIEDN